MENEENKRMDKKNPWLGLQSYTEKETIYGRDNDIQELTQCILGDKETLLYGKSGIGKSSILNAGVIPTSIRKGYLPIPVRFDHKKEDSYLSQIRTEIAFQMAKRYGDTNADGIVEIHKPKRENEESIYEYFHRHKFLNPSGERIKLLIIIDQFEEIFTLQEKEPVKKQFFAEMADFLNDIMPEYLREEEEIIEPNEQRSVELKSENDLDDIFGDIHLSSERHTPKFVTDNEVHIVFTIREDFLSEFEYYTATMPSLKHNRYGLRPLNEEQAAQIILRPMPGLVNLSVAKLIIEKVTNKKDFDIDGVPEIEVDSAVLSLYMNRLYEEKTGDVITAELVEEKGQGIIKQFYYDVIKDIDPEKVEFLEENLLNSQNRRENITEYDMLNGGHFTKNELKELCEGKNMILRKFYLSGDMRIEFIHDILCPVIKEHKEERIKLQQEEAERRKQEEERKRFIAAEEAKRKKIELEARLEKERLEEETRQIRIKTRKRRTIVSVFLLSLFFGIFIYFWYFVIPRTTYYAQFERVNGWPKGVGDPLSSNEMKQLPLYYKLSHKGFKRMDTDVAICSSNSRLPRCPRIFCLEVSENDSDKYALSYISKLSKIKSIHFEEGENGKLTKEVIKGENDSVLYYINYFYLNEEGQVWAQFISAQGQAMQVRENGLDRIRLSWYISKDSRDGDRWKNGKVTSMTYYDAQGVPQAGANGIYGYQMDYSKEENSTTLYSMNQFGLPHVASYNALTTIIQGDSTEYRYENAVTIPDSSRLPAIGPKGFWREVKYHDITRFYNSNMEKPSAVCYITKDKRGNIINQDMIGNFSSLIPAKIKYDYKDETGYRTSEEQLDSVGKPFYCSDSIYMKKWDYDDEGNVILEEYYTIPNKIIYSHKVAKNGDIIIDEIIDLKNKEYPILIRIDSIFETYHSSSYYGKDNVRINYSSEANNTPYHRVTIEYNENIRTTKYYYYNLSFQKELPQITKKDKDGSMISYYCKKEELDKEGHILTYQILDSNDNIIKSMMYFYQNGQNIGRAAMGIDHTPVRSAEWEEEGLLYYKLYYTRDFDNQYSGVQAVDEWENRSSIWDGEGYLYAYWFNIKNRYVTIYETYSDLNSNSNRLGNLKISKNYKQLLYMDDPQLSDSDIPYIHVLSPKSKMYNKGDLRDGDRIIKLGNWEFGHNKTLLSREWNTAMRNGKAIPVEVLRPNITSQTYEHKSFEMMCSDEEDKTIEYHFLRMTQIEEDFMYNFMNKNRKWKK